MRPTQRIVESKSLKLFLGSFRNHAAFHEDCTVGIGQRLFDEMRPHWLRIGGYWYPRGGIPIDVFWQSGEPPKGLWLPDQGVARLSRTRLELFEQTAQNPAHQRLAERSCNLTPDRRRGRPCGRLDHFFGHAGFCRFARCNCLLARKFLGRNSIGFGLCLSGNRRLFVGFGVCALASSAAAAACAPLAANISSADSRSISVSYLSPMASVWIMIPRSCGVSGPTRLAGALISVRWTIDGEPSG